VKHLIGKPFVVFAILFAASRACFYGAGLRFCPDHSISMMHFVDSPLLRGHLLETLWFLHGQPPLLSVFLAGVFGLGEYDIHRSVVLLHFVFLFAGLVLGWSWIAVLTRVGLGPRTAVGLAIGFSLLPSCIVFENYLFYTYPVVVLLGLQAACIARAVQIPGFWNWSSVFFLAAILALFKNVFHLIWVVGVIAIVWRLSSSKDRRGVLLASILPLVLVTGWYGKNAVVFGRFEASSWMGFGLARKTYHQLGKEERAALARRVDPIIDVPLFGTVDEFAAVIPMPEPWGVGLLDQKRKFEGSNNFHHAIYLDVCDRMEEVGWLLIREDPGAYMRNVVETFKKMFEPGSTWWPASKALAQAQPYCDAVDTVLHGNWGARGVNFWSILTVLTLLAGGVVTLRLLLCRSSARPSDMLIASSTFTASFILVLGLLLDTNETNRHRFLVDGLVVLAAILLAWRLRAPDAVESGRCSGQSLPTERTG
jgi:hypothetical protein